MLFLIKLLNSYESELLKHLNAFQLCLLWHSVNSVNLKINASQEVKLFNLKKQRENGKHQRKREREKKKETNNRFSALFDNISRGFIFVGTPYTAPNRTQKFRTQSRIIQQIKCLPITLGP